MRKPGSLTLPQVPPTEGEVEGLSPLNLPPYTMGVTEIFPKRRVSLAKQVDGGTQFPRKTLVWWFFCGFAAKNHHTSTLTA
jgi:hypothetical protein